MITYQKGKGLKDSFFLLIPKWNGTDLSQNSVGWVEERNPANTLVQEGRRQEAEGRRKESLYSKLFNLFQLDSYFRHSALVQEGRRQEAEGRREESLYSKLFNLFELVGYFCRAVLEGWVERQ